MPNQKAHSRLCTARPILGWLLVAWLALNVRATTRAQLVTDGHTAVLNGVITNIASNLTIGTNGQFTLLVLTNGAMVTNTVTTLIGKHSSAQSNRVIVAGTGSLLGHPTSGNQIHVGENGSFNELQVLNGGTAASKEGYLGLTSSSKSNRAVVAGPGSLWQVRSRLYLGYFSKGNQMVVSNGGTVTASNLFIGHTTANASNQLVIAGGTVSVSNNLAVNDGMLTVNSGSLSSSLLTMSGSGQPKVAFNGGTIQLRSTTATSTPFTIGDGTSSAVFEMLLNGTHTFPGGLIIRSNATLKGVGAITGSVTNQGGGSLSPGSSLAPISISGHLVFEPGGTNTMDLNAITGASDTIAGMTSVTYGGTLQLTNLAGVLTNGNSFRLFSAGKYTGAFDRVLPHTPGPGLRWNLDRLTVDGVLRVVATMPSPPPLISGATISSGNLEIVAANGTPYDPCVLLTSTNLTVPGAWTPCLTNYFDGQGQLIFTKPLVAREPQRYFRLQVDLSSSSGLFDNPPNPLTNGLVAYYRMDTVPPPDVAGTNNLTDQHPGILGDQIGLIYHCISAGGNSSGIRLSHADNSTFRFGPNHDFTVSTWVNANGIVWPGNFPVFVDKGCFNNKSGFMLYHDNTNFHFYVGNGTTLTGVASSLGVPDTSTWYNVVGRYSSTNQRIYLNVQGTNHQDSTSYTGLIATNSDPFSLFAPSTGVGDCWPQLMDDVGVWDRCLSDAEVQSLYSYGVGSGKGYPWATVTNTTILFQGDARFMYETTMQTWFSGMSWASNHMTVPRTIISMYVLTNAQCGDAFYGALETNLSQVLSYKGPGTNLYWVCEVGVNDIIVKNGINTSITALQIATALTNFMTALITNGVKVMPITIYDVQGFEPTEEADRSYLNNAITNVPGILGFLDTDQWLHTNATAGFYNGSESELTDSGNTNVATRLNTLLNLVAP